MSSWLDRWARRAAEGTPTTAPDAVAPARPASPSSRRDFLKKAGIVGGVAWSVPVLQTVMAPAASASVNTPLGQNCGTDGPNSLCAGRPTARCNGDNICGGFGALCQTNADCASNNCVPSGNTKFCT